MCDLPGQELKTRLGCTGVGDDHHIMDAVEASLQRLNTDFLDLYQTHAMDNNTPIDETMRALDDLVQQGKVRYLGCSNYSTYRLGKALWTSDVGSLSRFDCLQPYYSLLERDHFERDLAELVEQEEIGVIPYSPQAMGFLTGKWRGYSDVPTDTRGSGNARMKNYFTDAAFLVVDELEQIGNRYGKTIGQTALAWLLTNPLITAALAALWMRLTHCCSTGTV